VEPPAPHAVLAGLQQRVFAEAGGSPSEVLVRQHCTRRAQQASPDCPHRTVLGMLPSVRLQLPDDPPGLLHSVSCLLEAVAPGGGGPREQEAGADSQAPQQMQQPSSAAFTGSSGSVAERIGPVRLRLTVFAAGEAAAVTAACGCVGGVMGGMGWKPVASEALLQSSLLRNCKPAHLFAAPRLPFCQPLCSRRGGLLA
jgi:hypothetical protein